MGMIIAIDPGRTVGWAKMHSSTGITNSGQFECEETWAFLTTCIDLELIILEQPRDGFERTAHVVIENCGVIKEWARQHNVPVWPQTPSQGKHFFTDNRLAERGKLREPKTTWRHANDAMKHLLYYTKFGRQKREGTLKT